jgi:DNA polymerase III alpha subunit
VEKVIVNDYGQVTLNEQELLEAIYSGKVFDLTNVYIDNSKKIEQYNNARQINADRIAELFPLTDPTISIKDFDKQNQSQWFMPTDYCPNLVEYLYSRCTTPEQIDRVSKELKLFTQHNMLDVLYYCKYLVDTMREHKILWGVGRGSSVASYVLYLIGIHKIDSLKYNLDIQEFLK